MSDSKEIQSNNFLFMDYYSKSDNEFNAKLVEALDYLNGLDNLSNIFEEDNYGYDAFSFVCYTTAYKSCKQNFECFDLKECANLFKNYFCYFNTIQNELNFKIGFEVSIDKTVTTVDEKRAKLFCMLLYTINIYIMNSINFVMKFSTNNGLKSLLNFLADEIFLLKNIDIKYKIFSRDVRLLDYIVMNISALSKACEEDKTVWIELDAINTLLKISNQIETTKRDAYNAIINIADDKKLESLPEMSHVKNLIIAELENVAQDFKRNVLNRQTRQINLKGEIINCLIHCITLENKTIKSVIVVLKAIYKLTINEKIRNELYYESSLKSNLKIILSNGNFFEIYFALEVVAQLTFDKKITDDLLKDEELLNLMRKYESHNLDEIKSEEEKKIYKNVKDYIEQITWNMKRKITQDEKIEKAEHIMISYNTASRSLCLKIKENLEAFGFKVWIDVDEIHGSSLDAMAKAVEKSFCFLMCVTEKYRQSVNCQAEAQYAFKLNKHIIPIIMQSGYEGTQGWLGKINKFECYNYLNFII